MKKKRELFRKSEDFLCKRGLCDLCKLCEALFGVFK
jgi:hypothetical protein